MGKYRGALCRLCRIEKTQLFLKTSRCRTEKCSLRKKNYKPGQHGLKRDKVSEYKLQLREKQKVKRYYGLYEKQFRNLFEKAERMKGITGENLLMLLEKRLDNAVYRSGFAQSRREARNIILHRLIKLNGKRVDIPSFEVNDGDLIEAYKPNTVSILNSVQSRVKSDIPEWLSLDEQNLQAKIVGPPKRTDIEIPINEQLIVELYSK